MRSITISIYTENTRTLTTQNIEEAASFIENHFDLALPGELEVKVTTNNQDAQDLIALLIEYEQRLRH